MPWGNGDGRGSVRLWGSKVKIRDDQRAAVREQCGPLCEKLH